MKEKIEQLLHQAIESLQKKGELDTSIQPRVQVTRSKEAAHGHYASNIALALAKAAGKPPRQLAEAIVAALPANDDIKKTEIAGPGFINFFITFDKALHVVKLIQQHAERYGHSDTGRGQKVLIEFVSANPTGPLHVGHGRGAAYGASVASLMKAAGFSVDCEYYVNDAGRQMNILATSIWLRYLQQHGVEIAFPSNGYRGDYIEHIAQSVSEKHKDSFVHPADTVMSDIPADEPDGGDKEQHIDALTERAQQLLGEHGYDVIFNTGLDSILDDIRDDLEQFGVHYDNWYSEKSLAKRNLIDTAIKQLKASGHAYENNGALWFRSTAFGDEKDRVITRENGQTTYFASDIAYHMDKFQRGYDRAINIWGADHHGYVPRVKAAIKALGEDENKLDILLVQFAILYRGGERVQMSTRSGSFVTLRELRKEVGNDAARFFYVMRKCEQHMDFDLDLAKSESNDNPVYYIQYAHARVCSVVKQLEEKGLRHNVDHGNENLTTLDEQLEQKITASLADYPDVLNKSAINAEPHAMVHYLRELANLFHSYYNAHQFIVEDDAHRDARLNLIVAVRQVIYNGLTLLGVSAPESM